MALKPEMSLTTALATGTVVYAIYNHGGVPIVDQRVSPQGDGNLEAVRKQNAWVAASVVAGISLLAKDATVFIVGGAMVIALDWATRAAIWTNPLSGRIDLNPFTVEERNETPADTAAGSDFEPNLVAVV